MSAHDGSDRVGGGEASLGQAQSSNPPEDPEMLTDTSAFDADTEFEGDGPAPVEERDNRTRRPTPPSRTWLPSCRMSA